MPFARAVLDGRNDVVGDVLDYITDNMGELPAPRSDESWSGMAVFYLSVAVELWASAVEGELETAIDDTARFLT